MTWLIVIVINLSNLEYWYLCLTYSATNFQSNFSSSESTLTGYKLEIDNLKKQLQASESNTAKLKSDVDTYKGHMTNEKKKMERQLSITQVDKVKGQLYYNCIVCVMVLMI